MDDHIKEVFEKSKSTDKKESYEAYLYIIEQTEQKVDWAYDVWDSLLKDLTHGDNHERSRAAQYLANLAKSDPDKRMLRDFPKVWQVTYDEKFVTTRHALQSIWKVGLAGTEQSDMVMTYMTDRFRGCSDEKNYTLIRSDIIQNMKYLFDHSNDVKIKQTAMELIETVEDEKYRKKYGKIWK